MAQNQKALNVSDVSRLSGMSRKTIYKLIADGELSADLTSGRGQPLFYLETVRALMLARSINTSPLIDTARTIFA